MEIKGRSYTREDIVRILDAEIKSAKERFSTSFWADRLIKYKTITLGEYDAGMVVLVEREPYTEDGMDFEIEYYSDGSTKNVCYGYTD